jgi:hypothetical protein
MPTADNSVIKLASKHGYSYAINGGSVTSFRVWPKTGCDSSGYAATYIDPVIMYSCPFTTSQLLYESPPATGIQSGESQGFYNLSTYCNVTNGYCTVSNPNGGAASMICNNGPINNTKYVQYIHSATSNIYAQTYDDVNGNLSCNSTQTKTVFTVCPAN